MMFYSGRLVFCLLSPPAVFSEGFRQSWRISRVPSNPEELLVVSQFYWPEPIGIAPYAHDLAEWFSERGTKVTVLTARPNYPDYRVFKGYERGQQDESVVNQIRIHRVPTRPPEGGGTLRRLFHEGWLLTGSIWCLLTGSISRHRRVVSFSPSILFVLTGYLARRRGGVHVAVVHDIQSGLASSLGMVRTSALGHLMRILERITLNHADQVVVLTSQMKERLEFQGVGSPIDVIPLWVDTDQIFPIARAPDAAPTVIYSGNLGHKQGLGQILAMAEILLVNRPSIKIIIRGQGSQAKKLREETRKRQLLNVELRSLVPANELNRVLSEADIHLVPQISSGADFAIPSKIYSIMASGRPFICTAEPGSTLWLLQKETKAFLCSPPNDPGALADAVSRMINSPEQRAEMAVRGRAYVEEHLGRNTILPRFVAWLGSERCDRSEHQKDS